MNLISQSGARRDRAIQGLHVRSALNPMLWLTGIITPVCFTAAYFFRSQPIVLAVLIAAGILPIVVCCFGYGYFALKKPEKLQSEDFQLRRETLEIAKTGHLNLDDTTLNFLTSAELPQIDRLSEEDGD